MSMIPSFKSIKQSSDGMLSTVNVSLVKKINPELHHYENKIYNS